MKVQAKLKFESKGELKTLENGTALQKVYFIEEGRDAFGDLNGKDEKHEITIFGADKIDTFNKMLEIRNSDKAELKMFLNTRVNTDDQGREFFNLGLVLNSITWLPA